MNMPFSRPSPIVYREDRDDRTDIDKLKDALEAHEKAAADFARVKEDLSAPRSLFNLMRDRYDNTQSDLFVLIEDMTCVSAERLQKVLAL